MKRRHKHLVQKKYVLLKRTGRHHPVFKGLSCLVLCKRTRHGFLPLNEYYDPAVAEAVCKSLNNR